MIKDKIKWIKYLSWNLHESPIWIYLKKYPVLEIFLPEAVKLSDMRVAKDRVEGWMGALSLTEGRPRCWSWNHNIKKTLRANARIWRF